MSRGCAQRERTGACHSFTLTAGILFLTVVWVALSGWPAHAQGPCGPPVVNPIACENTQPGTPQAEWDIVGSGDPNLQGFATDISVNVGETVRFKIDTVASSYRLDMYRIGYYNGAGARFVATLLPSAPLPQAQPPCLTEPTTGLVDCGNWAESASWAVPANSVSGVYIAKLVRTDGPVGSSHIVFIVRNDTGNSDILYQTSDATWQAYNDFGGNSLYAGGPGASPARAYKVSYNRPFNTRGNIYRRAWLFGNEYPMIRWLERNGYNVSYFTGVDTARRGAELLGHRVFLSVGHDEYWSAEQRASVEAARNAGVHLGFFSGNEVFWKTRWEPSIDGSGTPYRTLVSYKETNANAKIDPLPNVWTGTWRDPRFSPPADGGRPENGLTGTIFMVNCCRQDSITVPEPLGKLRLWRNTSVATLQSGQTATLPAGVLGYEWDEDLDNGVRPDGLIRLSSTTVSIPSQYLLDYGSTYGPGTATHSLTLYRHQSGALVFSAGSSRWSWGLDGTHDFDSATPGATTTPDGRMQQATVNLLADMGVQPGTLQSGLVAGAASSDTTAPTSTVTSPSAGATVYPGIPITISGTASDTGGSVVAAVEVSVDGGVTWHPAVGQQNWAYTWVPQAPGSATIVSSAVDDNGNIEVPAAGVQVQVVVPPPDLGRVAAYSFDVLSGANVTDISGNGHTGTVSGATWTASGKFGGALSFDGIGDWVTVAGSPLLDLTTGMTLSAWVYPTAHGAGAFRTVLMKEAAGGEVYDLYSNADTNAPLGGLILSGVPGLQPVRGDQQIPLNAWTHLALTFDTTAIRLFVNGSLVGSLAMPGTIATSSGVLRFGGNSIWNEFFEGRLDEIRIYNRSLLASEIQTAMNTPIGSAENQPPTAVAQASPTSGMAPLTVTFNGTGSSDPDPGDTIVAYAWDLDGDGQHDDSFVAQPVLTYAATGTYSVTLQVTDSRGASSVSNPLVISVTGPPPNCPCTIWSPTTTPTILADPDTSPIELGVKFRADVSGFATGIRFYKGPGNTGTHIGRLWTSTGTLLASVTFSNETASGWQQANFPSAVAITANTTYVASYFAPVGRYSANAGYFATAGFANPPLTAPATGAVGGNGVFRYGISGFPTSSYNGNNYWVDPVFSTSAGPPDTTPPTVSAVAPADGAIGVSASADLTAIFSEPLDPATITTSTFELRDPANAPVAATVTYDEATRTATFNPTGALAAATTYTATIRGGSVDPRVKDLAGNALAADFTWSFTTAPAPVCPCSLWSPTTTPTILADPDSNAVEVGVKFVSEANGVITALRFYKGPGNTGTHVGHLWTSTGTLLASVTFANETISGWQEATLASPVPITANTTYVASYYAPVGRYSADAGYFATAGVSNPPLNAPATGAVGGNGVFKYGASGFPTLSANGNNYWVDVVFNTSTGPPDTTPPTINAVSPATDTTGVSVTTDVSAIFSEPIDPATIGTSTFELRDPSGAPAAATVTYDAATRAATLTPTSVLADSTTYTATIRGGSIDPRVKDFAGNPLEASFTWSFTTAASPTCPCSLWTPTTTPAVPADPDSNAVEVGVKFRADADGFITGLRFYKGAGNSGTHVGNLWTSTGTLVASVTFSNETASGWQSATFSSAVPITANTTYVASYHTAVGHYAANAGYFATSDLYNPPLRALATGTAGGNGVFKYGASGFPTLSAGGNNYWVDVVFNTVAGSDTAPPTIAAVSPANGGAGVSPSSTVTVIFSETMTASTINTSTIELRTATNTLVAATVTYNAGLQAAVLTPASPLASSAFYSVTVKGGTSGPRVTDVAGNALAASFTWGFTTATTVTDGFSESIVFSGLTEPSAVRFASDGRVFVAEKSGLIKVFSSLTATTPTLFADLRTQTHNFWDRGLLGLELDPSFPTQPYVYVLYTYDAAIGGTAPQWGTVGGTSDGCPDPPGATTNGCVVSARLSRLEAAGGVMTGPELVLIEDWGQQFPSHSIGSLAFGSDGALYISSGDGASFNFADYGQSGIPPNPLGDPPVPVGGAQTPPGAQGGALRSQSLRRAPGQPVTLDGSILRVDPNTGNALPDNPLFSSPDANARRIVGYGLRNPFRLAMRPGTSEIWIGEVGWNEWEEINVITNPLSSTVTNFGWPCYEGVGRQLGYEAAGLTMCTDLFAEPAAVTAPFFTYNHGASVVDGDGCSPGSSAVTGITFYNGSSYPSAYQGALFFADYARGCIWTMFKGVTGDPDPATRAVFRTGAASPVDLRVGPGGDLFYVDIIGGTVRRIRFSAGNQAPTAVIDAQPLNGPAPLTVTLDGAGSTDPDPGDILTYSWDRNGDGVFGDSTAAQTTFTYTTPGNYTVSLRVTDNHGASHTTSVVIAAGNSPPTAIIDTPAVGTNWQVSQQIAFSGHATDPQQGTLAASALSWSVILHHCPSNCHTHVVQTFAGVASGVVSAPDHEYPSQLELVLTATDAGGLESTASVLLDPTVVALTFASSPSGLQIAVNGGAATTPFSRTVIVGSSNSVSAPSPQSLDGSTYDFASWSDGGAQSHNIVAGTTPTTYTATFALPGELFSLTDTAAPDFTAGTPGTATYVAQTSGGELILAPTVGAEFAGTALPTGWFVTPWATGGTGTVGNGSLVVNGARSGTNTRYGASRSLEFVATFTGAANQHLGFGITYGESPYVRFSTLGGGALSASTRLGGTITNTAIPGSWLNAPHRFRIDWNPTTIVYSIDGTVVVAHTQTITTTMRPLASDSLVGGGTVTVDWLRMAPYPTTGTFTSRVLDAGGPATWNTASWTSSLPSGTTLSVRVRSGNTPTPDATWSTFTTLPASGASIGVVSRYLQHQATLSTSSTGQTPVLQDITLSGVR